jgi:hypothetical protein
MSSRIVRADQVWLGLLQEAHERAGFKFPGLCREHHRARHSTCCFAAGRVAEVPPKFARVGGSRPDFGPEKAKKHKKTLIKSKLNQN